ncbi:Fe-S cluster assembly protein SufD [Wenyingzhuangia marina]|uniref:Iron-regulated ABC transporter permease protein SufD n=1 Tax=Wenyingzhuangia marina TaxID=1195760 RepID=A0A1M5SW49_9FLAO|nr:Fe-S cluster assembly protein SufD [Wenyingzhuangia marina]GGF64408.1 Fe-S cluster assembly protein SufD [Wenyingzhuangia marina]SHH42739.1 Iron-regulated ABC transporter permease protein SufD [Wenyingzhuangia marina]
MSLQNKLAEAFKVNTKNVTVENYKKEAFEAFSQKGFPTTKDEEWKYTSLRSILKNEYGIESAKATSVTAETIAPYLVEGLDSYKLIFLDGVFQASLSDTIEEVSVKLLSEAIEDASYEDVFKNKYNSLAKGQTSLTDLNTAFTNEGVIIEVAKSKVVSKPVELVYLASGETAAMLLQPRNLIIVGENAQVKFIERHQSIADVATFNNVVTEVFVGQNGIFDLYKIQNDKNNASLVDATFVSQERDTVASVYTFSFGGNITRNNLSFSQNGPGCDSILNGVTILEGDQLVDNHTLVDHKSPDCQSNETYKGIYGGKSTGVFNGKVIVDQAAQRINAYQQNDSVLISDSATINSKPQLEIFADDVKCSHGCTIGQLDKSALFYMQQRGIPKVEAEALLMFAFCSDAIKEVKIPALKRKINQLMADKLGVNIRFDEI